jgi:hypothetical protein
MAPPPAEGEEPAPAPEALPPEGLIETDAEYVQWVMDEASKNYGQQKRDQEWQDAYEAEKAQRAGRAA